MENGGRSFCQVDTEGIIKYVNPAFEKLTGYTRAEAVGETPRILKSGGHDQKFYQEFWDALLTGAVMRTEFTNQKKSGEFYHQSATITPIKDEQGKITHFVATDRDITRQVRSELEELQLQERLGSLKEMFGHLTAAAGDTRSSRRGPGGGTSEYLATLARWTRTP